MVLVRLGVKRAEVFENADEIVEALDGNRAGTDGSLADSALLV